MPEGTTSLQTIVGVGIQNQHSSHGSYAAVTEFRELKLTDAYSTPTPTIEETEDEFDGSGSIHPTSGGARLGVMTPFEFGGRLRLGHIAHVARAAGFAITTQAARKLVIANATGGTFTLTFNSQTTAAIAYNATAAAIQAALEALNNVRPGDVAVQGSNFTFEFAFFKTVSGFSATGTSLTGSTPTATVTTSAAVYAHAIEPVSSDANFPWSTWYHSVGTGSNQLKRLLRDSRLNQLAFTANRNSVARFTAGGMAIHEEIENITETTVAEVGPLARTIEGGFALYNAAGTLLTGAARSVDFTIANEFPANDDNFDVGSHEMGWMTWLAQLVTGNIDVAFNKTIFQEMFYGGASAAGSGYSFVELEGALNVRLDAAAVLATTVTKPCMNISVPYLNARGGEFRSSGRSEIRLPVAWRGFKSGSEPIIRLGLVNGVSSYA